MVIFGKKILEKNLSFFGDFFLKLICCRIFFFENIFCKRMKFRYPKKKTLEAKHESTGMESLLPRAVPSKVSFKDFVV
jgi:hypothetical protein